MHLRSVRIFGAALLTMIASSLPVAAGPAGTDGVVQIAPFAVPPSDLLSAEAKAAIIGHFQHPAYLPPPVPLETLTGPSPAIDKWRSDLAAYAKPAEERVAQLYPVTIEEQKIAGVPVEIMLPKQGVDPRNQERVLIELHGGGFLVGARMHLQGPPVAALGRIKVVSVDYRQFPEAKFPAASEDVAAVYRELLKSYRAENIGLFGCSAGGMLSAQAVAWFAAHDLPRPGAIGIFCAGAGAEQGDSPYVTAPLNGFPPPPPGAVSLRRTGYFAGTDARDPLAFPASSAAVLEKFPPTLVMTATRDQALSAAVDTHRRLLAAGVAAELRVWDGLGHGFYTTDPDLPESREAQRAIVDFFDRRLGGKPGRAAQR